MYNNFRNFKSTARPDTTYELEQTYKTIPGTIVKAINRIS